MPYYAEGKVLWLILSQIHGTGHDITSTAWRSLFETKLEHEARVSCRILIETYQEVSPSPAMQIVVYSKKNFRTDRVVKYVQRILKPELIDVRESERKYVLCHKGR